MKIFDTHAHYNDEKYDADRDILFAKMYEDGVKKVTLVGASLIDSEYEKKLAIKYNDIQNIPKFYFTVGDHPDDIIKDSAYSDAGIDHLKKLEDLSKIEGVVSAVAIGEIGLDYHGDFKDEQDYKNQKEWFIEEIKLAKSLNLPIVIHSRDACKDTLDIIKEYGKGVGGIAHCFSYEPEIAVEYVKLGYKIGIGGTVTFKNARKTKEVVDKIDLSAIVTETDAPWLTPTPYRGTRNESSYIRYVIETIAEIKNADIDKVSDILYQNALDVYNIKE